MLHGKEYGPWDILAALRRRCWWVVVPLWVVAVATVVFTQRLPNSFESEVRIQLVPAGVSDKVVPAAVSSPLDVRLRTITEMVLNSDRLQQIVSDLNLYQSDRARGTGDPVARIRGDFRARVAGADSFVLTYAAPEAQTAKTVAERLGAAFIDENRRRSEAVAGAATDFLDSQLDEARTRLEANEQQLAAFNASHAGELPSQLQSNLQMLQSAQAQLQTVGDALARDRDEAAALDRQAEDARSGSGVTNVDGRIAASTPNVDLKPLEGSPAQLLQAARRELSEAESHLKPEHPDVVRLKRRVADLDVQVKAQPPVERVAATPESERALPSSEGKAAPLQATRQRLARQIATRQTEEERLKKQIEDYRVRIDATPARESELTAMMRDYGTLKDLYSKLLAKKEEAKVSAKLQENDIGEQFVIAAPATLPARPASPNRPQLNIVGTLAGLLLGLGLAALREYADTSLRNAKDIAAVLDVPLLATIPVILTTSEQRWTRSKRAARWLATASAIVATVGVFWRVSH